MKNSLKVCPYCKKEPVIFESRRPDEYLNGYFVSCDNLNNCIKLPETRIYSTKEAAVKAWNSGQIE